MTEKVLRNHDSYHYLKLSYLMYNNCIKDLLHAFSLVLCYKHIVYYVKIMHSTGSFLVDRRWSSSYLSICVFLKLEKVKNRQFSIRSESFRLSFEEFLQGQEAIWTHFPLLKTNQSEVQPSPRKQSIPNYYYITKIYKAQLNITKFIRNALTIHC